ncbi:MAG: aldehyde ferredoxin oxidoreductase C-terminal domain-containing protein [Desulfobacterales bacterium]|nr:aldehyde ferredoxin oxidoreductase C-terminal domain-containing protein [Desulfobacterales bacterium]
MTANGYAGRILQVDLTTGKIDEIPLDMELAKAFIGGVGLNNRLAYDIITPGVEALAPENPIILGTGPFAGTPIPGAGKVFATSKVPLSGAIATASGGGSFGSMLKYAGYDHVVITGRAATPVYLKIDGSPELRDAAGLWGKDIFETSQALWKAHRRYSVMAIGAAGENRVGFSFALIDMIGHLGRGGLGAVFGSKNLKAVVAGPATGLKVADPARVMQITNTIYRRMRTDPLFEKWTADGCRIGWKSWCKADFPTQNSRRIYPGDKAKNLFVSERFHDVFRYKPLCCFGCPMADKGFFEIRKGEFAGLRTYASEYLQAMVGFGITVQLHDDYNQTLKCLDYANREGIDLFTATALIAFADELFERGIITGKDTGGLTPRLGDFDTIMEMMRRMVHREGFGDVLADGWKGAIARIGQGVEAYAPIIKGIESAHYDFRQNFCADAFNGLVEPRGPNGPSGESPTVLPLKTSDKVWRNCDEIGVPFEVKEKIFDHPDVIDVALYEGYVQDWYQLLSSLDLCVRQQIAMRYTIDTLAELYTAVTGVDISVPDLRSAGERALNMTKVLNVREGFSRKDDVIPDRLLAPLKGEAGEERPVMDYYRKRKLARADIDQMTDEYYQARGWDKARGIPTREKLIQLGLADIAQDMEKGGWI